MRRLLAILTALAACKVCSSSPSSSSSKTASSLAASDADDSDPPCRLFLETQTLDEGQSWTLFAGVDYNIGDIIGEDDLVVLIDNANKNEFSPWHDVIWSGDTILPEAVVRRRPSGPSSSEASRMPLYQQDIFIAGVGCLVTCASKHHHPNIQADPSSAFTRERDAFESDPDATSDIRNYIFKAKHAIRAGEMLVLACFDDYDEDQKQLARPPAVIKSLDDLNKNGKCADTIQVKESTIEGAGRGAFARRFVAKNETIAISPVVHLDRSQTEIVRQSNYSDETNPRIDPLQRDDQDVKYTSHVIGRQLLLNYLYGHVHSNIQLLPMAPGVNFINHDTDRPNVMVRWLAWHDVCDSTALRETTPVMELLEQSAPGPLAFEFVALEDILPNDELFLSYGSEYVAAWASRIDHSSEELDFPPPFRHEIGVPNDMYPQNWMTRADPRPHGDFIASPLATGHMAPIRWAGSAEIVTPWAFRIGLHDRVGKVLLEYCNKMGITDILRHVTSEGNGLEPGSETHMELEGDDWYMQRPDNYWRSNLHWFSPGAGPAHEHYLQALSIAGFDEILQGIGDYLGMDGLVAFHVTFIGVSFSNRGFLHTDVTNTSAKVYNVIIPLVLANETGPELDLLEWRPDLPPLLHEHKVGRYRYEYNIATMMGDGANHATSACDYRNTKEMRMAATVYIADVNEQNVNNILNHYTQAYPPRDVELLKSWIARHWKRGDPTRKLPKPEADHILLRKNASATMNQQAPPVKPPTAAPTNPDDETLEEL